MRKYYIGLLILGIITLGLSGYVITLGAQARQDTKTEQAAQEAATKINSYVSKKQKIPASLSDAGVTDAPSTISYTKLSSSSYKFCATYKAAKGYGGATDISNAVTGAALNRVYGSTGATAEDDYSSSSSYSSEASALYINYTHKKGEDCQTVKPYLYSSSSSYTNPSDDYYCDPSYKYYSTYKSYCENLTPDTTLQ